MKSYTYLEEDNINSPRFRKIISVLLILALLGSIITILVITGKNKRIDSSIDSYNQAIEQGDYVQAISIYRDAREKALSNDPALGTQNIYKQTMDHIETDIDQRLDELFAQLKSGEHTTKEQLAFAEGMAEIAGVKLIAFVREQSRLFLNGKINSQELRTMINPLVKLQNVNPVLADLPDQIPAMALAAPLVTEAESNLETKNWYKALNIWQMINSDEQYGSFARDYALDMIEHTRQLMYEPLLEEAVMSMQGGRYVTAAGQLNALQEVFPQDQTIISYLAECSPYIPEKMIVLNEFDPVEIITIRPLIVNEDIAFDQDQYAAAANDAMMTANEFKKMLEQLYVNNYVLIDAHLLYDTNGSYRQVMIPEGKKPLVLILDSLNYYITRRETGNVWNLSIDSNGSVKAVFPDSDGNMITDAQGEAVGILDEFVYQNPDFSYDGAKGVISFTGYECIFGYVVSPEQAAVRNMALVEHGYPEENFDNARLEREKQQVIDIISKLKQTGWSFGSSTYNGINLRDSSLAIVQNDTKIWLEQVGSLTGSVNILNYPYGAFISEADERHQFMREQGFRFFAGQGITPYRIFGSSSLYADRLPINGFTMRQSEQYSLNRLFNVNEVYDSENRP